MIREVIQFELRLGPETDRFRGLFRQVRERMERAGVVPGAVWTNLAGDARYFIVERTFASLAQYEQDDSAFHGDEQLMNTWREMEGCLVSMHVNLWQQIYPDDVSEMTAYDRYRWKPDPRSAGMARTRGAYV